MNGAPPYLEIAGIAKRYRGTPALQSVSLDVSPGEFLSLLGPSGCGKSTLLRILAGLVEADAGTVVLDGMPITDTPAHRRDIGLVFQNYALFPHMSVADNVRFGLDMRGIARAEAETRVREALALVKLEGFGDRRPRALSGGQQQRVALARAIVIRPRLLLLDEPLSNLDAVLRAEVRGDIRDLHDRTGVTTIMVTHDQAEAMTISDRIAVMAAGAILQHDTPQRLYGEPAQAFVAAFVGSPPAALVPVRCRPDGSFAVGTAPWTPLPDLARHLAAAGHEVLSMGLRPEALDLVAVNQPGALPATIRSAEYLGADWLVRVEIGGTRAVVRCDAADGVTGRPAGLEVRGLPPVFDTSTGARLDAAR